jgi:hypothetical protein
MYNIKMQAGFMANLPKKRQELQDAEAELADLEKHIRVFEATVDNRLGELLDQLSDLNAETALLDDEIRMIREQRLYGTDLMQYSEGAPRPARPKKLTDLPPQVLTSLGKTQSSADNPYAAQGIQIPDIKTLYRKLARRYHPDLARNPTDRAQSNRQMAEINQAYAAGDLTTLFKLAGIDIPYGVDLSQQNLHLDNLNDRSLTEAEQLERKINLVRQRITRLTDLPLVRLSLEVKLARHQRRDLLNEMATELRYKVARKTAERDYLQAQIKASGYYQEE